MKIPRVNKRLSILDWIAPTISTMACSVEKTPLKPYCSSFLNYVNSTSLDIALKVSSSERRRIVCSIDRKCPNFSLQLYLRTRGELMLANFGLKIRPFWDSDHENWYSYSFLENKAFCENNLHQITYVPKSYLWTKNEGNRFINSCHSMRDISWQSLLTIWH